MIATGVAAFGWAWVFIAEYGTVFPQSLRAKAEAPWFKAFGGDAPKDFLIYAASLFPLRPFFGVTPDWEGPQAQTAMIICLVGIAVTMALGATALVRRRHAFLAIGLGGLTFGYYGFYALANPAIFDWYYVPLGFFVLLFSGLGWASAVATVTGFVAKQTSATFGRGIEALAALGLILVFWITLSANAGANARFVRNGAGSSPTFRVGSTMPLDRIPLYMQAGWMMNAWLGDDKNLIAATPEIGAFSFYFGGRVLDPYGLVSPEALRLIEPGVRERIPESIRWEHPTNIYWLFRPDFVMTSTLFMKDASEDFLDIYEEVERPDVPLLKFYIRKGLPEAVKKRARRLPEVGM